MAKPPVLIVEDEVDIAHLIEFHLKREGYTTRIAHSGADALEMLDREPPALVLLDIMMPDVDGLEVCRRIKREPNLRNIPIIMVTARGEESDIVVGLELGAEDYITKPFSPRVLVARVKTVLRRKSADTSGVISISGAALTIDSARHIVQIHNEEVDLTLTQYRLLHYLALRPGFVRTRDQIVSAVRGEGAVLSSRVIDVHIAALRQKLGEFGELVETVRGVGYRLAESRMTETV